MEYNSVYDALRSTRLLASSISRPNGGWIRIPAIWRSASLDGDVAINIESGVAFDHALNQALSFKELMEKLNISDARLPNTHKKSSTKARSDDDLYKQKIANTVWDSGKNLSDDQWAPTIIAKKYLESRKIPANIINSISNVVRASKMQYNKKGAMLLLPIRSPITEMVTGIQRIFLNEDGTKRTVGLDQNGAEIKLESKMMLGHHFEGAFAGGILLAGLEGGVNRTVVICEGFETGLAILAGTGMSIYVAYNTNGMEKININYLIKKGFTNIIVAADNDDLNKYGIRPGIKAATILAGKIYESTNRAFNISLSPRMADGKKCDWLDIWDTNAAKFKHLFMEAQVEYDPATDKYSDKFSEKDTNKLSGLPQVRVRRSI